MLYREVLSERWNRATPKCILNELRRTSDYRVELERDNIIMQEYIFNSLYTREVRYSRE